MALTEGRVPGGRQRMAVAEELSMDDEDFDVDLPNNSTDSSPQSRNISQSLPRIGHYQVNGHQPKNNTLPNELERSLTLDRKKKPRTHSFKFGNFMQKMVRQMSIHSPKTRKKRSQSMTREAERLQRACNENKGDSGTTQNQQNGGSEITLVWEKGKVPGVVGIRNHGNTCFMNAVIQCLSHTDLLVEYLITDHYKHDIKRNNKQNARKYGTKGELTENLATLIKSIWTCQYNAGISSDFKAVVGKFSTQYKGYSQHDAQEFLMWLLDKVHEDLNVAAKKKFKTNKTPGRTDDPAEILSSHMRSNNSLVYDVFQAVYRSTLTCPHCRRQSNTYDPFLSISLPIPQKTKRPLYVTVVYHSAQPRQVRIGLLMDQGQAVRDLRMTLAADTKIPEEQLLLTELYAEGFQRTFHDSQALTELSETDSVYAIEVPDVVTVTGAGQEPGDHRTEHLTVLLLNQRGAGADGKRFGSPVVVRIERETSYEELQKVLLTSTLPALKDTATQKLGVLFRLRVLEGLQGRCYLPHDVEHPLYMPTVDRALSCCIPGSGPEHIKIIMEWDQQTKPSLLSSVEDSVEEHTSVRQVQLAHEQPVLGTLDECFQLYTQDERLNGDDAWHCPNCRRRQQGTIKSIKLWSLPDILVIHLKRFKQEGVKRNKLNTLITFPVTGLDMSHHACERSTATHHSNKTVLSPWRRGSRHSGGHHDDLVFDLYGVCNHYGNMQGGHYTAFCKNTADSRWYTYDDTTVTPLPETEVVTRAAYLLFYQRRPSTSRPTSDPTHWIHALSRLHSKGAKVKQSKSEEDLLDSNHDVPAMTPVHQSEFSRTLQTYATLRAPVSMTTTPTRGVTVGQLSRQREQKRDGSPQVNGTKPGTPKPGTPKMGTPKMGTPKMGTPKLSTPKPGTPSSVRSDGSDYDNLAPSYDRWSPRWQHHGVHHTVHHGPGVQRSASALVRQSSVPHDALLHPVKSPSADLHTYTRNTQDLGPRTTPDFHTRTTPGCKVTVTSPRARAPPPERPRAGLTRSLTSPEVTANASSADKRKHDKKMAQYDYGKNLVFLQESCV